MHYFETQKGIGAIAMVAIVAVIALGGAAAYQYSQQTNVGMEADTEDDATMQEEAISEAQAEARADLLDLRSRLQANANIDVAGVVSTLTSIRNNLQNAYAGASAQLQAELDSIETELDAVEQSVVEGSSDVQAELDAAIETLGGSAEGGASNETEADSEMDADATIDALDMDDDDDSIEASNDSNASGEAEAGMEAEAGAELEADDAGASAEAETSATGSVDLY